MFQKRTEIVEKLRLEKIVTFLFQEIFSDSSLLNAKLIESHLRRVRLQNSNSVKICFAFIPYVLYFASFSEVTLLIFFVLLSKPIK